MSNRSLNFALLLGRKWGDKGTFVWISTQWVQRCHSSCSGRSETRPGKHQTSVFSQGSVFWGDVLLLSNLLNGKSDFLDFFDETLQTSLPPLIWFSSELVRVNNNVEALIHCPKVYYNFPDLPKLWVVSGIFFLPEASLSESWSLLSPFSTEAAGTLSGRWFREGVQHPVLTQVIGKHCGLC